MNKYMKNRKQEYWEENMYSDGYVTVNESRSILVMSAYLDVFCIYRLIKFLDLEVFVKKIYVCTGRMGETLKFILMLPELLSVVVATLFLFC